MSTLDGEVLVTATEETSPSEPVGLVSDENTEGVVEESDVALSPADSDPVAASADANDTFVFVEAGEVSDGSIGGTEQSSPEAGTLSVDGQAPIVVQDDDAFLFTATEETVADTPTPDAGTDLSVPGDELDALPSTLSAEEAQVQAASNDNTSAADDPFLVA